MVNFAEIKEKIKGYSLKTIIVQETNSQFKKNNLQQCPFCDSGTGKNKSSAFHVKNNLYHCFSCDEGGDIIHFIEKLHDTDYAGAMKYINNKYLNLSDTTGTPAKMPVKYVQDTEPERKTDKEINTAFIDYIDKNINDRELKPIKEYLNSRNISISDNIHILTDYSKVNAYLKNTFNSKRLNESGLFSDKDNLIFFEHQIIFTHYWNKYIIYMHARTHKQDASFKYMYQKCKKIPFNLNALNSTYRDIFLVEGVFDALSLIQDNKLAISLGSVNVTIETLKFIVKKAAANHNKITVLFDNDKAANKALTSDKYKEFGQMLAAANVSYSFEQTIAKDINEAYNKN